MKSSILTILATLAVGAAGCGGSSTKVTVKGDMAAGGDKGDMAHVVAPTCSGGDEFPNTQLGAFFVTDPDQIGSDADYSNEIDAYRQNPDDDSLVDIMIVFDIHTKGAPAFTTPVTHTFTTASNLFADTDGIGVQYIFGASISSAGSIDASNASIYAPQGGSLTVTSNPPMVGGTFSVTGTNVHLVEWQQDSTGKTAGMPKSGGGCLDVTSFDFSKVTRISGAPVDM